VEELRGFFSACGRAQKEANDSILRVGFSQEKIREKRGTSLGKRMVRTKKLGEKKGTGIFAGRKGGGSDYHKRDLQTEM